MYVSGGESVTRVQVLEVRGSGPLKQVAIKPDVGSGNGTWDLYKWLLTSEPPLLAINASSFLFYVCELVCFARQSFSV